MLFSVLLFLVVLGLGLSASPTPAQTGRVRVIANGEDVALAGDAIVQDGVVPYATVNGERRPIPVPLVAVLGRVLVPAQWVFDALGDVTRCRHHIRIGGSRGPSTLA